MKFLPLSERSDSELKEIVALARKTSVGAALFHYGFNLVDVMSDPVGHLMFSIMLDEVDREELSYWVNRSRTAGRSEMSVSDFKGAAR
jgi:hypothetical protein